MFSLRRPDIPGVLLALLVAVAFISFEASHTHAHQQMSEHASSSLHAAASSNSPAAGHVLADHHQHEEHAHLRLVAISTAKAHLFDAPMVTTATAPRLHNLVLRLPTVFLVASLPPGLLEHGPPPPSRAPPLV